MKKDFRALGDKIKELREKMAWTQLQLASRLRINRSRLANIERGHEKPSNAMLFALSDLFSVVVTDIYPDIDISREVGEGTFYKMPKEFLKE